MHEDRNTKMLPPRQLVKLQRKQSQRKSERRNHRLGKPQSSAKHAMVRPLPQPAPISSTLPGLAELQSPSDTCPRAATAREHFPCSRPSYTNARPPHNPVAHLLRGSTSIRLGLRPPHSPDPPRAAATSSPLRNPADEPCPRRCDTSSPGCTAPSHRRPRPSPKARRTQPPSASAASPAHSSYPSRPSLAPPPPAPTQSSSPTRSRYPPVPQRFPSPQKTPRVRRKATRHLTAVSNDLVLALDWGQSRSPPL